MPDCPSLKESEMRRPGPVLAVLRPFTRRCRGHGSPSEATTDRATGGILADQLEYGANHHRRGELCVTEPAKVALVRLNK